MLTPEQMILQTPTRHELIDKKAMFIFDTVPQKLYEIWVWQLSKVIHFSLHKESKKKTMLTQNAQLAWNKRPWPNKQSGY
jgi:hypothetical protein